MRATHRSAARAVATAVDELYRPRVNARKA
jgi:hypothetical protein